jgi:hypothetical protein
VCHVAGQAWQSAAIGCHAREVGPGADVPGPARTMMAEYVGSFLCVKVDALVGIIVEDSGKDLNEYDLWSVLINIQ